MKKSKTPSFKFYPDAAGRLLLSPGAFFDFWGKRTATITEPAMFLLLSSCLFAGAGTLICQAASQAARSIAVPGIFFANAVGMACLAALLGHLIVVIFKNKNVSFKRLFGVYAFASGITLLFSWVPLSLWLTEPWKWWLIYTGLTGACGLKREQALLVIGLSIGVMILIFRTWVTVVQAG